MYGNIVSLSKSAGGQAENYHLVFFDVDHIFPFSRGGRSVVKNFEAVQYCANRFVKGDNLVPMLSPVKLQCGLSKDQFIAIVEHVYIVLGNDKSRRDVKVLVELLENTIFKLIPSRNEEEDVNFGWTKFQEDVNYSLDGKYLFEYLIKKNRDIDDYLMGIGPSTAADEPKTAANARDGDNDGGGRVQASNSDKETVSQKLWGPSKKRDDPTTPFVQVQVSSTMITVFGDNTKLVKDNLKDDLKYSYHGKPRYCWDKMYSSEEEKESMLKALEKLVRDKGMNLV